MEFKNQEPIKFEFFQSDMEKIMYQINQVLQGKIDKEQWEKIQFDIQHKIECHKEMEEWL